jgi:hypothetical protein
MSEHEEKNKKENVEINFFQMIDVVAAAIGHTIIKAKSESLLLREEAGRVSCGLGL